VPRATLEDLCPRCRQIDFGEILRQEVTSDLGSFILDLNTSTDDLIESKCPLCRLFGSMAPSQSFISEFLHSGDLCHLRAFSANRTYANLAWEDIQGRDAVLIGVFHNFPGMTSPNISLLDAGRSGTILQLDIASTSLLHIVPPDPESSVFAARSISLNQFDVTFAADCLNRCLTKHGVACKKPALTTSISVIDCHSRKVVKSPPDCRYVALSYVWGHANLTESTANAGPEDFSTLENAPNVIEASIDLTLKLNLRYLWVDRYCIDQSDEQEKYRQIKSMDLIYANAQLTIIAAAGADPSFGLPGLRDTLRTRQPSLRLGDYLLVSSLKRLDFLLGSSIWNTRGWTYQESIFSNRRLVFTEEQVFFECNGMHCTESLIVPLDEMHEEDGSRFKDIIPGRAFPLNDLKEDILGFISEYSMRDLTLPGDAINAMEGIFQAFSRNAQPTYHFFGIPIRYPGLIAQKNAKESFLFGLCWYHTTLSERVSQFPSWTWAGWRGGNVSPEKVTEWTTLGGLSDVDVRVEDSAGNLISFPELDSLPKFLSRPPPKNFSLHIEASVVDLQITYLQSVARGEFSDDLGGHFSNPEILIDTGYYAVLARSNGRVVYVLSWLDTVAYNKSGRLLGILLGENISSTQCAVVLLVREIDSRHERVGIACARQETLFEREGNAASEFTGNEELWFKDIPRTRRTIRLG